jgi:hypothetical protein
MKYNSHMLIQVIGFLLLTAIICLVVLVPKDGVSPSDHYGVMTILKW